MFPLLLLLFGLCGVRLAYLQFFHPNDLSIRAKRQHQLIRELPPFRGKILDRLGMDLALDLRLYSLGANARAIQDDDGVAEVLSPVIGESEDFIAERLRRDKSFVWLSRKLSNDATERIRNMNHPDLELRPEWKRVYPNGAAAGQLLGFTGIDHDGLEGVEYSYDSYLRGIPGWKATLQDAKQRELVAKQHDLVLPVDGYDVRLTLDMVLQHAADQYLRTACETHHALGGSLVVMDALTGDVMAMSNYPSFDPNLSASSDPHARRNRAITDVYEPGSVFKIFTAAAALEEEKFLPDDLIYCERGEFRAGGRILHDVRPYGILSFADVIAKSSNIGTAKIAVELGADALYGHIRRYGFGEKTRIDLPGEVRGILSHPKTWSKTSISSIPMGQEVAVTAIQLTAAASAIVNGGVLMKPRIVKSIVSGERMIKEFPSTHVRQVLSKKTSDQMRQIMRRAVESGTGKNARVEGARVGGKTGTAQKIEPDGSYSHTHFIASFLGFIEAEGKIMTILVSIDDPTPRYYGGTVAAPVFAQMASIVLDVWRS